MAGSSFALPIAANVVQLDSLGTYPMTRTAFRLAASLALLSTSQLQAAPSATPRPCMTPAELRGTVAYVMPLVMTTLIERCKPALPARVSLLTHGAQLVSAFEAGRSANFPLARKAFAKFSDAGDKNSAAIMLVMPEAVLRPLLDEMIAKDLTESIKVRDCPDIDRVFATLEPLPASNVIDLITQVVTIATRNDKKMSVCAS